MSSFWGTPTWIFFHTFAEKIDENFYLKHRKDIINIIYKICNGLPCPICQSHALEYLKKVNERSVNNKSSLIAMFIHFHNTVNLRLGKKKFDIKNYEIYKNKNIKKVFNNFKRTYGKQYISILARNNKEYNRELNRISLCKSLFTWLKVNIKYFI